MGKKKGRCGCAEGEGEGVAAVSEFMAPQSKGDLRAFVREHFGMEVPDQAICSGHQAPMDYLWHAYSADFAGLPEAVKPDESADCIVWAGRGGGKTRLAAAATMLDSLFKPGCRSRILAGSLDQSSRMFEYFSDTAASEAFYPLIDGRMRTGKCRFINGSDVGVLAHSARDVRGIHIHKLRCDEAELFKEDVFRAAQFVTKSKGGIRGAMEVFSTMHQPYGVMQRLIDRAEQSKMRVFRWCVWEVIERCVGRTCSQCPLWSDCGGRALNAAGYLSIDDVIDQMRRSSRPAFEAEMLCRRPRLDNAVFEDFSTETHVCPTTFDPALPLYMTMDFGYRAPFVCLWVQVDNEGMVRVIDEYIVTRKLIGEHGAAIIERTPGGLASVTDAFCDPAGTARNTVTGTSDVSELKTMGIRCKYRASGILDGLELIRRVLKAGDLKSRFVVDPRCSQLIEAMRCYHYPEDAARRSSELPAKDGVYDHPIDALRYFFVNHGRNNASREIKGY